MAERQIESAYDEEIKIKEEAERIIDEEDWQAEAIYPQVRIQKLWLQFWEKVFDRRSKVDDFIKSPKRYDEEGDLAGTELGFIVDGVRRAYINFQHKVFYNPRQDRQARIGAEAHRIRKENEEKKGKRYRHLRIIDGGKS